MSSTTARVLRLLSLLQSRSVWTGPELAHELGVTDRSVRRDVERLRELGYPVHAAQGVGGGYRLGAGRALPPLLLDDDEAVAVAVALRLSAVNVVGAGESAIRALDKLEQVLPRTLRSRVKALQSSTDTLVHSGDPVEPAVLMTVARAIRDQLRIRFEYAARGGDASQRYVEPYRLVATGRRWYLVGWDIDRDDWRTFRLDRVGAVTESTWRFAQREGPDAAQFVQQAITQAPYSTVARVRVKASADLVRARLSEAAAQVDADGDEHCVITAGADTLGYLCVVMANLGYEFEVLEPPGLVDELRRTAQRLLSAADRSDPR